MKNQYEQHCNAAALKQMGIPVVKSIKDKNFYKIGTWLNSSQSIEVNYPDETEKIIETILNEYIA